MPWPLMAFLHLAFNIHWLKLIISTGRISALAVADSRARAQDVLLAKETSNFVDYPPGMPMPFWPHITLHLASFKMEMGWGWKIFRAMLRPYPGGKCTWSWVRDTGSTSHTPNENQCLELLSPALWESSLINQLFC